ncbi:MAG: Hsp70 family protein, partial [Candidatus Hinthialibacter sp.]
MNTNNPQTTDVIAGIDLGTTNSSIAVYHEGQIKVLEIDGSPLTPSYVGISPENDLLVGRTARNQYILYPERTIKSIKRRMGKVQKLTLGEREFLPEEISALILDYLKKEAEAITGESIRKAVITVPAFFNDQQRQATKAAGEIAGLEVVRILNEPTAASLAYDKSVLQEQMEQHSKSVVYDLGGGTFDISIVQKEGEITEVLASHGDTQLGGDDFDRKLLALFLDHIRDQYKVDLTDNKSAMNRLTHAAEA